MYCVFFIIFSETNKYSTQYNKCILNSNKIGSSFFHLVRATDRASDRLHYLDLAQKKRKKKRTTDKMFVNMYIAPVNRFGSVCKDIFIHKPNTIVAAVERLLSVYVAKTLVS